MTRSYCPPRMHHKAEHHRRIVSAWSSRSGYDWTESLSGSGDAPRSPLGPPGLAPLFDPGAFAGRLGSGRRVGCSRQLSKVNAEPRRSGERRRAPSPVLPLIVAPRRRDGAPATPTTGRSCAPARYRAPIRILAKTSARRQRIGRSCRATQSSLSRNCASSGDRFSIIGLGSAKKEPSAFSARPPPVSR